MYNGNMHGIPNMAPGMNMAHHYPQMYHHGGGQHMWKGSPHQAHLHGDDAHSGTYQLQQNQWGMPNAYGYRQQQQQQQMNEGMRYMNPYGQYSPYNGGQVMDGQYSNSSNSSAGPCMDNYYQQPSFGDRRSVHPTYTNKWWDWVQKEIRWVQSPVDVNLDGNDEESGPGDVSPEAAYPPTDDSGAAGKREHHGQKCHPDGMDGGQWHHQAPQQGYAYNSMAQCRNTVPSNEDPLASQTLPSVVTAADNYHSQLFSVPSAAAHPARGSHDHESGVNEEVRAPHSSQHAAHNEEVPANAKDYDEHYKYAQDGDSGEDAFSRYSSVSSCEESEEEDEEDEEYDDDDRSSSEDTDGDYDGRDGDNDYTFMNHSKASMMISCLDVGDLTTVHKPNHSTVFSNASLAPEILTPPHATEPGSHLSVPASTTSTHDSGRRRSSTAKKRYSYAISSSPMSDPDLGHQAPLASRVSVFQVVHDSPSITPPLKTATSSPINSTAHATEQNGSHQYQYQRPLAPQVPPSRDGSSKKRSKPSRHTVESAEASISAVQAQKASPTSADPHTNAPGSQTAKRPQKRSSLKTQTLGASSLPLPAPPDASYAHQEHKADKVVDVPQWMSAEKMTPQGTPPREPGETAAPPPQTLAAEVVKPEKSSQGEEKDMEGKSCESVDTIHTLMLPPIMPLAAQLKQEADRVAEAIAKSSFATISSTPVFSNSALIDRRSTKRPLSMSSSPVKGSTVMTYNEMISKAHGAKGSQMPFVALSTPANPSAPSSGKGSKFNGLHLKRIWESTKLPVLPGRSDDMKKNLKQSPDMLEARNLKAAPSAGESSAPQRPPAQNGTKQNPSGIVKGCPSQHPPSKQGRSSQAVYKTRPPGGTAPTRPTTTANGQASQPPSVNQPKPAPAPMSKQSDNVSEPSKTAADGKDSDDLSSLRPMPKTDKAQSGPPAPSAPHDPQKPEKTMPQDPSAGKREVTSQPENESDNMNWMVNGMLYQTETNLSLPDSNRNILSSPS